MADTHADPEPLFEQISETDHRCTRCRATNTCESDAFPQLRRHH
ncbi:hypothetical protein ACIA8G_21760 [Lentzea sp. NPDC051213]